ncbi:MAG: ABC transporter permease [Microbacterium sp.]
MSLVAASRSELTKQFSVAAWWVLALILVVYVGFTATALAWALAVAASGAALPGGETGIGDEQLAPFLYSLAASIGYVFPVIVGTLIVTSELRHQTLTPTFLATPRRGLVLAAKLLSGVVLGLLFAVLSLVSTVAPAAALLAGYGLDPALTAGDTWALLGRIVLALVLWTLVGVGIGTLVRNQVAAIVIVLAFTQFVEPIVRLASASVEGLRDATAYLPGAAGDALVGYSFLALAGGGTAVQPLEWWAGGLVLAGYALVLLALGHLLSWRRDVG